MTASATAERADLTIKYDGQALRDHSMSVRDLAPALLGLADVFQAANETLNPGHAPVSLDIRATDEGSFLVELAVIQDHAVSLLASEESVALVSLVTFIAGGRGLFSFLRRRNQRGNQTTELPNGVVRITLPDGTTIEFSQEVLALYRNSTVRRGAQAVIAPLSRTGIDEVELAMRGDSTSARITSEDLAAVQDAINDDAPGLLITDQQYEQLLTVTSPNFQPGNKWRMNDGQATYWVAMEDPQFLAQIDRGEIAFRKDDRLRALVWLRQWSSDNGDIHTERSVIRVLSLVPRPDLRQGHLPGM